MKGSLQVSIGFLIVMIVAALTMIFIMGWMGQLFPTLQDIGTYATEQAKKQMMDEFAEGTETVLATIPTHKEFAPGTRVKFSIGIKKQAGVDEKNFFTLCVGQLTTTDCNSPAGGTVAAKGDTSGVKFIFSPFIRIDQRGDVKTEDATMEIGSETATGLYGYKVYVCAKASPEQKCTGLKDPDYYGDFDFIVEVK